MTPDDKAILKRQIARAKKQGHLSCRQGADGHHWQQCKPDFKPDYGQAIVQQCTVCGAIKRQVVSKMGERLAHPEYEYPDGYLYHKTPKDSDFEKMFTPQAVRAAYAAKVKAMLDELPEVSALTHGDRGG